MTVTSIPRWASALRAASIAVEFISSFSISHVAGGGVDQPHQIRFRTGAPDEIGAFATHRRSCSRPVRPEGGLDGGHIGCLAVHHHKIPRRRVVLRREVAGHNGRLGAIDRDGLLVENLRIVRPCDGHTRCREGCVCGTVDRATAVVTVQQHPHHDSLLVICDQDLLGGRIRQLVHGHINASLGRGHEVVEGSHPILWLDHQRQSGWSNGARRRSGRCGRGCIDCCCRPADVSGWGGGVLPTFFRPRSAGGSDHRDAEQRAKGAESA